jgi:hypothetical protein
MSQVNVELFFAPNTPISLNQVTVRNLFQKPNDQALISLWDGFGKSNIGKPKNPQFTLVYQTTARVSWGASDGICNKYTVTVKDAATDSIVYGPIQNFTTIPLQLFANLTELTAGTSFKVHLLASNTAITPLPTAETIADLLTLENVPLNPTTPVVNVISKNILRVTASATYASSYDVYEVISGTDTLIVTGVQIPYDHNVLTYSLHTYKVKGRSTGGVGPMSAAAAPTRSLPDFPIAVSTATCTIITSSSVRVTWSASTSPVVINYRVIATLAVSPFTEVYNSGLISNLFRSLDPSSTSSPAASFNPATLYTVKVQTINEAGTAETTTSFTTKTAQPAAPTATATSQTAITVTWGSTTGADSYVLYRNGVSLGTKTSPINDTTGITVYSLHSYQVSAVNVSGESVLSTATSERSWPELPVAVTNVVLTPGMNNISSQWQLAATTSTRTADNYRVFTYLKTNMSTPIDTSALLSSTTTTSNTTTQLVGWTQYTIRIYTYNRAGSVYIDTDMTTLADIRPDPQTGSIGSVTNQEPGATNVEISQVTIGTFQPGYNTPGIAISASNGQFQTGTSALTTGWVTTATVIPDGSGNIVFKARMNASSSETTTVTSTFTIGDGTRTFSVTTRDPNPPTGVSATGGIGIATISWTNLGYTYIVSGGGQSKTVSNIGSVVLGDSVSTRISGNITFSVSARNALGGTSSPSTASANVTPMPLFTHTRSAASVDEGSSASFGISTSNVSNNSTYNWSISGVSAADFSSMSYTSTNGGGTSMTPATSGSFIVYNSVATLSFTMSADHLTEGPETITFSITGSPTGDFSNGNISMTVGDTSLDPDYTPAAFSFNGQSNVEVNTPYSSGSVTVTGLEPSWPVTVSASGGTVYAGTSSANVGPFSTATSITTNSIGHLVVNATVTSSSSYKSSASVTVNVGTGSASFSVTTTANEQVSVSSSVDQGTSATLSASGGFGSDSFSIYRTALSGNIISGTLGTASLDSSGNYSVTTNTVNWGTASYSLTFNYTGHTRTSGILTVKPVETVSMSISGRQITVSIGNGYPSTNWSVSSNGGTGTMSNYNASVSWPTQTLSSTSTGGTWSTTINVSTANWGTWYFSALFAGTGHTITSNTITVAKSAPNVIPVIGTITPGLNSLSIPFTISASTAGPIDGVAIIGSFISGNTTTISGGAGTITATGLSTYTTYTFGLAAFNNDATGTTSSTVSPATLADTTPDSFALTLSPGYSNSPNPTTVSSAGTTITGLSPYATVSISWSVSGFTNTLVSAVGDSDGVIILSGGTTVTASSIGTFAIAFLGITSSTWGGVNTLSLTVGTVTNSTAFSITNKQPDLTPTLTIPANATGQPIGGVMADSGTFTVYGLEPNYNSLTISASNGTIGAGTNASTLKYATNQSRSDVSTDPSGNLLVVLRLPTSYSPLTTTTMTFTIGTFSSGSWSATTVNVAPSTPTISSVTSTAVSISISWSATFTGGVETAWEVGATSSTNVTTGANALAASTRNYTFTGLTHSTSYSIYVTPYNSIGAATPATTTKATTTPTIGTFAWSPNPVANGGSSTFSGSLSGGVGLTGSIAIVATSAGTWSTEVSTLITSNPQTISWTLNTASYTARSDHTYLASAYFIGIVNYTSGTQVLTVSAPVVPFTGILVSGSITPSSPWSYFYTATHTRTYTFTVMGTSVVPFDVVLAVNGTEYDLDQVRNAQNQNIGESISLAFTVGAEVAISVRGYTGTLSGSFSLQIS